MPRGLRLLTAFAAMTLALSARATNGMRLTGFGPVQSAMGGVGVGATLDAGAIVTNPAGLSELDRRLDASVSWFRPKVDYSATGALPIFVVNPGTKLESSRDSFFIPNLGIVVPLGAGLTTGIGVFSVAGLGTEYAANLYSSVSSDKYQMLRVAPAIAYKANDVLSVGVTLNAMWAQLQYDIASGAPFNQAPHDTASSYGIGATIGIKVTPVRQLNIGVAYETRSWFQDFSFDVPADTRLTPLGPVGFPGGKDKLQFDQPAVATAGVAYRPVAPVLLALEVEWINWSDTFGHKLPRYTSDTTVTGSLPLDTSWRDQLVFKIGAEVALAPTLKLRAGFNHGKTPLDAGRAVENILLPAVTEDHFTIGAGWQATDALSVNVAGTYSPRARVSGANLTQGIVAYETSMTQYAVDLGIAWRF
jgi:long-chain fatty acid transport protein